MKEINQENNTQLNFSNNFFSMIATIKVKTYLNRTHNGEFKLIFFN